MPQDAIVELVADTWTELTTADSTTITLIHREGAQVIIQATTTGDVSPLADDRKGLLLQPSDDPVGAGFLKRPITELSHVADVDRVWAFAIDGPATLYVQADA